MIFYCLYTIYKLKPTAVSSFTRFNCCRQDGCQMCLFSKQIALRLANVTPNSLQYALASISPGAYVVKMGSREHEC